METRSPIERAIDAACGVPPSVVPARRAATAAEKEAAKVVAEELISHIDQMYPAMWQGVPKTARTSVKNTVYNQTLAALVAHK